MDDLSTDNGLSQRAFASQPLPMVAVVLAQQSVLLPLYFFIPLWISVLNTLCAISVVAASRFRQLQMKRWLKLLITLSAIAGVLVTFHRFAGRDAGVALIAVMYGLKILETTRIRDANLLLSLGFFILLAGFLFTQKPWIAFYQLLPIVLILNALVAINRIGLGNRNSFSISTIFKDFSRYLILALPIMLILFVFFPRLGGPIWRMPGTTSASSGISDSMSPGAISDLQLFDKVAMRVKFTGEAPNTNQMYWRAIVLDEFDGLNWTRGGVGPIDDPADLSQDSPVYDYAVTLERTQLRFLVTLDRPVKTPRQGQLLQDFVTYSSFRILDRTRYSASSSLTHSLDTPLTTQQRLTYTRLPKSGNRRSRSWAEDRRQLFNSDLDYIQDLLLYINRQEYFYTLQPPIMDEDIVDSFWLDYQRGFCEHYAGALVFLARAAGIPARVVVGYQGAEKNPLSDYWIVRYADAHAWTEIWIEGRGWMRVDPTSAIATHRVEASLLDEYRQRDSLFDEFDFVQLDNLGWGKQVEYWMDQFNDRWNDWVLDYNNQSQRNLFENWGLKGISSYQMVVVMLLLTAVIVLFSSVRWFHQRKSQDPLAAAFERVLKKMGKRAIIKYDSSLGPQQVKQLLSRNGLIKNRALIAYVDEYIRLRYRQLDPSPSHIRRFIRHSRRLHIPRPTRSA